MFPMYTKAHFEAGNVNQVGLGEVVIRTGLNKACSRCTQTKGNVNQIGLGEVVSKTGLNNGQSVHK